jgi:hypothetical protein
MAQNLFGPALMGLMFGGSMAVGGYESYNSQKQIESSVCSIAQQMKDYKKSASIDMNNLSVEVLQTQNKLDEIVKNISTEVLSLNDTNKAFKDYYNKFVIYSVVFLLMLIFVLGTKKLILKASTEK